MRLESVVLAVLLASATRAALPAETLNHRSLSVALVSSNRSPSFQLVESTLCQSRPNDRIVCHNVSSQPVATTQTDLRRGLYTAVLVDDDEKLATSVADFAAWSGTPVVRIADALVNVHAAFERPALIVVPSSCNQPGKFMPTTRCMVVNDTGLSQAVHEAVSTPTAPSFTCAALPTLAHIPHAATTNPRSDAASAPLGLAMIVRNEGGTIERTLDSARGHIDGWTLLDTGSTDDTVRNAKNSALARVLPGVVSEAAFEDFAITRNKALRLHGPKTAYTLMPDADFMFVGLWRLRTIAARLETECRDVSAPVCAAAMKVVRRTPGVDVQMIVVFPWFDLGTPRGWHYEHPVHEVAMFGAVKFGDVIGVPPYVRMEPLPGVNPRAKSPARWKNFDLPVLEKACAEDPSNTRNAFYLARTYHAVEDYNAALDAYARRIQLGGWFQEIFFSHYEMGRIKAESLDADPTDDYLAAAAIDGERAETFVGLAKWHDDQANKCDGSDVAKLACQAAHRAAGYVYGKHAATLSRGGPPPDKLFLLTNDYDWGGQLQQSLHAYWLTEAVGDAFADGWSVAKEQVAKYPGQQIYINNAQAYERLAERMAKEGRG